MLNFNECNINIITFYHISKVLQEKKNVITLVKEVLKCDP